MLYRHKNSGMYKSLINCSFMIHFDVLLVLHEMICCVFTCIAYLFFSTYPPSFLGEPIWAEDAAAVTAGNPLVSLDGN